MTRPTRAQCELMGRPYHTDCCPLTCPEYHPHLPVHCGRLLVDMASIRGGFSAVETAYLLGLDPSRVAQLEHAAVEKLGRNKALRALVEE